MNSKRGASQAFTMTELLFSIAIGSIVAALTLSYMHVSSVLVAKNLSTNYSHNSMHKSIDWVTDRIQEAEYIPVLLTGTSTTMSMSGTGPVFSTSGSSSASTQSTEVVGIYYDRLVGSSYVFPSNSGTISPSATTVTVQYSTNVYANPPAPSPNDIILVLNGNATTTTGSGASAVTSTLRPMVSSAVVTTSGGYQSAAITLNGSFGGTGVGTTWTFTTASNMYQTAMLVHREAFIVVTNATTGNNELRYYPNFEGITSLASPQTVSGNVTYVALTSANLTALNNSSNYQVISDQMGTNPATSAPYAPFSEIVTDAGATLVGIDLRIRGSQYNQVLDGAASTSSARNTKEAYEFSQFARIITIIPLREHPVAVFQ